MSPKHERTVSISAVIIALAACVTSVWQGIETRTHNRLSVTPKLSIVRVSATSQQTIGEGIVPGFYVENNGAGPAVVVKVRVYVEGAIQSDRGYNGWDSAISELGIDVPWVRFYGFNTGDTIGVRQRRYLLYVVNPRERQLSDLYRFSQALENVKIEIEYESIYKEDAIEVYDHPAS